MADEIRQYTLTVPAGTLQSAPVVLDCSFPPRRVVGLQVVVPSGASGALGFQVRCAGVVVVPYLSDQWVVTSGEVIQWPVSNAPESGSWQVAGYNTGTNGHSAYFRFLLEVIRPAAPAGGAQVDDVLLSANDYPIFGAGS